MYLDSVTVFTRYEDSFGDITWYPTFIRGVNLLIDKAAIIAKYGAESKDNAVLNIRYKIVDGKIMVDGKPYLPPKEWERQTNDKLSESITFASGTDFGFFIWGEYPEIKPISDSDFDNENGFFNYVNSEYDYVFAITSVAIYSAIPHFEIVGA